MRKVAGFIPMVDADGWWLRFPWGRATMVMFGLGVAKNVAIELVGAPTPLYLALLVLVDLAFVACLGATIMRWRPGNLAVWGLAVAAWGLGAMCALALVLREVATS